MAMVGVERLTCPAMSCKNYVIHAAKCLWLFPNQCLLIRNCHILTISRKRPVDFLVKTVYTNTLHKYKCIYKKGIIDTWQKEKFLKI